MMAPVVIVEYSPAWPTRFRQLAEQVIDSLGSFAIAVEHVGSTAVPGLAAKPVIDMNVVVQPADIDLAITELERLGYVHQGDLGITGREAFLPPKWVIYHHLYLVTPDNQAHLRQILFRDYLRSHKQAASEYAEVKRCAALKYGADRKAYSEAKTAVIEKLLGQAQCQAN
jgi:GrpB-like predicted nucleotidyltransferase (UPF0157 family)